MFDLDDDWVWDFWVADDGDLFHLFFLKAPRTLGDPHLRHWNASTGHAVSRDLRSWERLDDALAPQPEVAFDDLATWTGCCVRDESAGLWRMYTTGLGREHRERRQRVGLATSPDLARWTRSADALVVADPRWYASLGAGEEEHWRDPWVVRGGDGRWHMFVTAQSAGPVSAGGRGVVGHAVSDDLERWEVGPPLCPAGSRFGWLEVVSVQEVEGRWVLLFSCLSDQMPGAEPGAGGVWSVAVDGPGARFDADDAVRLTDERLYVGKVLQDRAGAWQFLAFRHQDDDGRFVGGVIDPVPVRWRADARGLELAGDGAPAEG